ncbi:MAG TPA: hypothetical protein ENF73_02135 [Proteobacteria bacterium]|nr:hypothetical protein [Pseudomonadota bacterium]
MARTIAVASQKGGVAKTTTVVNLAASLAVLKYRTVAVDLDPQNAVGYGLGLSREDMNEGIYDVLNNRKALTDVILPTSLKLLKVIPCGRAPYRSEERQETMISAAEDMRKFLQEKHQSVLTRLRQYMEAVAKSCDYLLIDCPPGIGEMTIYALASADSVLIPMQCEPLSMKTLTQILRVIRRIRKTLNPKLVIEGILITMYDEGYRIAREVYNQILATFPQEIVFRTVIPRMEEFTTVFATGRPVILQYPDSEIATAYLNLARELTLKYRKAVEEES